MTETEENSKHKILKQKKKKRKQKRTVMDQKGLMRKTEAHTHFFPFQHSM